MSQHKNDLSEATSPYLLQHANNPVNWVEWNEKAFDKAKREGKLVLVSIGYSACHWCHVMERESFENEDVAQLMNEHFICIKVDREERPDVDQVYMNAVQLMTQQGGWPLNCFTLPDGRPIYGGTYFPKKQWMQVLRNLWDTFIQEPQKVEEYATKLSEGVRLSEMIEVKRLKDNFDPSVIHTLVSKWKKSFDFNNGGENRAPKFPLPNNYEFLLHYGFLNNDDTVKNHVHLTLRKMARGGIYDQIGGGFSRYSVDPIWKVPHFEKMLYDNGQLLSLYAKAYQQKPQEEYKKVLIQTVEWLRREMFDSQHGGYFSALDADSEGVEGKFYTWTENELKHASGEDYEFAKLYFNINEKGYWEDGVYILVRNDSNDEVAERMGFTHDELLAKTKSVEDKLLSIRANRIRPGLDNKKITSWNALLAKGFIETGTILNKPEVTKFGEDTLDWIISQMWSEKSQRLYRVPFSNKSDIKGFLDDYSNTIDALITAYERTFNSKWIKWAEKISKRSFELFTGDTSSLFYYTEENTELIARKMEINDNVIPSSNSVMAKNLFRLGIFYANEEYSLRAKQMLTDVYESMPQYGSGYSNWAQLALFYNHVFHELAIVGSDAQDQLSKFNKEYLPHVLFAGGEQEEIPFLLDRKKGETYFYVCQGEQCNAPVENYIAALNQIKKA